jgi:anthranilate/para-aminobenzoate synthase component II
MPNLQFGGSIANAQFEMTTEMLDPLIVNPGPSKNQKSNSALVGPEHYHGARPAPDNFLVSPGPSENQEAGCSS